MAEHEHKGEHHKSGHQKANYVMLVVVGLLLLFSVVQAFQINALENRLESGSAVTSIAGQAVSQQSAPVARAPAPTMVGGC